MPEQASQPERRLSEPVSFLMPVCNEVDVIRDVLDEWHEEVFRHLPDGTELILDDGASTDGTLDVLDDLAGRWGFVRTIRSARDGFAASARRLYQAAQCPLMFFTDSDGQYVPAEFWRVAALIDGADMVAPAIRRAAGGY
jgi:glycosyltransferase involved in cell wall biosynthesis